MRNTRIHGRLWGMLLGVCVMALLLTSPVLAAGNWVDEISNMVAYERDANPGSNFDPYFAQLNKIQAGVSGGDQQVVKNETEHFLKMLANRDNGINDVAADEIYNFAMTVRPMGETPAAAAPELGAGSERLMSVPDHTINTPYEGGPKCPAGGCDYWNDDVFDPGAS
ncbi:MAG TPA: hypothetical protein VLS44_02175 [Nitrospira sp.]|nr:hypothetical protein [Nitrospira sp.]